MTEREFKSYTRGLAYHVVKFEDGEITDEELSEALRAHLGQEVFEEVREIINSTREAKERNN